MRHRGLTIRDVAARAGVSIAAVSQALNGKGTLSAATRERIVGIAAEMGYEADALARGMTRSRMGILGLVFRPLDSLSHYNPEGVDLFSRLAGYAGIEVLEHGMSLTLLHDLTRRPMPPLAYSMDGYLVVNPFRDDAVLAELERRELPYVMLGRDFGRPERTRWVSADDAAAMRMMLDHLAESGAGALLLVEGTDENAWNADSAEAFRAWCAERGLSGRVVRLAEDSGVQGGRELAGSWVEDGEELPDAVVCMTGRHAAGVQAGLHEAGCRRVLIATMSDSEQSRGGRPPITAMRSSIAEEVRRGVAMLDAVLAGEEAPGPVLLPVELEVRGSTSPLP
ncbi:LacI family DNA-binding transcriptional regulator [Rothia halotolerans]|uniref:LacI family DNA-binding transcriptional regulator n=1 Tax=Rothia halotolerans TaxID=405770 RepID=UPI00101DBD97|nr:LacI family DNA-binding transcriptional regulator [Rothia halotolerans]